MSEMTRYRYIVELIVGDGEDGLLEEDSTISIDSKEEVSDMIRGGSSCSGGAGAVGVDQWIDDVHHLHVAVESSCQYCE